MPLLIANMFAGGINRPISDSSSDFGGSLGGGSILPSVYTYPSVVCPSNLQPLNLMLVRSPHHPSPDTHPRVTSSKISPHVYHLINIHVSFHFSISYPCQEGKGIEGKGIGNRADWNDTLMLTR